MTSNRRRDDDLEQRLERFLADSAPPLPAQVLGDVVATISRTSRARRGRLSLRMRGLMPVFGTIAAVALIVVTVNVRPGLGPGGVPTARTSPSDIQGLPRVWDPHADFAFITNPGQDRYGNPDVWSYRQGVVGATVQFPATLMTEYDGTRSGWTSPIFPNLFVLRSAGVVSLHPWSDGSTTDRAVIVAWTSPVHAEVFAEGTFRALQRPCEVGDTPVEVSVHRDSEVFWTATLTGGDQPFQLELQVEVGTTLSFVVSPLGNANCDGTDLGLAIRTR